MQELEAKIIKIKQICCKECGFWFSICRSCYRGHRYCSNKCKKIGYRKRRIEAQRRYRKSKKGKTKRKQLAKAHRYRKWENKHFKKNKRKKAYNLLKKTTDKTIFIVTKKLNKYKLSLNSETACHFCGTKGIIVEQFTG